MQIQLNFFDALADMLCLSPIFLAGFLISGLLALLVIRKGTALSGFRLLAGSFLFYYYLCILFKHVVGMPTLAELLRMYRTGESLFHPVLSLIPFQDGFSISFLLNIVLFLPMGFLCPVISVKCQHPAKCLLMGTALTVFVETGQMFTMYRATDIDDLAANILGTLLGYLVYRVVFRGDSIRYETEAQYAGKDWLLPVGIVGVAFVMTFFS